MGGVKFHAVRSYKEAIQTVFDATNTSKNGLSVRFSNAYCVALASKDLGYRDVLNGPGLTYPDGAPVALLMKLLKSGRHRSNRVRGPSFFETMLDSCCDKTSIHAFVGTTDTTLAKLSTKIASRYPSIVNGGTYSPPFTSDLDTLVDGIAAWLPKRVDYVWLGLGSPKQDLVGVRLAQITGSTVLGVGAAFDFMAGTSREAPPWIQHAGAEWIYRFLSEPRRLWRRYIFGNTRFILLVLAQFFTKISSGKKRIV